MTENLDHVTPENPDDTLPTDLPEEPSEEELADLMARSTAEPPAAAQESRAVEVLSDEEYNEKVKQVKKRVWIALAAVLLVVLVILGIGVWDALVATPNKPIASMEGSEITVQMYQTRVRYLRFQLLEEAARIELLLPTLEAEDLVTTQLQQSLQQLSFILTTPDALGTSAMNSLLEDLVLEKAADSLGIVITEEAIDAAFYDKFKSTTANPENYTTEKFSADYDAYIQKRATANLTEADIRALRRVILVREMVMIAVTAELAGDAEAMQTAFNEWLLNERMVLAAQMEFDDELMERSTPNDPKLTDPKVFEALYGITIGEYQATLKAQGLEE